MALGLRSPAFPDRGELPLRYRRVSPPLEWARGPSGVVEYALTCVDRSVREGSVAHWVVAGIPAQARSCAEGALPEGAVAGRNDFGELGWTGLDQHGEHRCYFDVFALDRHLDVGEGVTVHELWTAIGEHAMATGTLIAVARPEDDGHA